MGSLFYSTNSIGSHVSSCIHEDVPLKQETDMLLQNWDYPEALQPFHFYAILETRNTSQSRILKVVVFWNVYV